MPYKIIGTLVTKEITIHSETGHGVVILKSEKIDVIEVIDCCYITNRVYKPGVPQIIHKELVESYSANLEL